MVFLLEHIHRLLHRRARKRASGVHEKRRRRYQNEQQRRRDASSSSPSTLLRPPPHDDTRGPDSKGRQTIVSFRLPFFCVRFQNPKQNVREDDDDEELAFLHIFGTLGSNRKCSQRVPFLSFFLSFFPPPAAAGFSAYDVHIYFFILEYYSQF